MSFSVASMFSNAKSRFLNVNRMHWRYGLDLGANLGFEAACIATVGVRWLVNVLDVVVWTLEHILVFRKHRPFPSTDHIAVALTAYVSVLVATVIVHAVIVRLVRRRRLSAGPYCDEMSSTDIHAAKTVMPERLVTEIHQEALRQPSRQADPTVSHRPELDSAASMIIGQPGSMKALRAQALAYGLAQAGHPVVFVDPRSSSARSET